MRPASSEAPWRPRVEPLAGRLDPDQLDPASSMNGVKMPIELEPPPTQAITRAGSAPSAASACSRASSPITRCRSRTSAGKGAGPTAEPIT